MSVDIKIEELKNALEGIASVESGWRVISYQSDFEWLWGLSDEDDTLSQWLVGDGSERNLVIIWDGMPDDKSDGINILDHLTPYDWALSFSYQQLRECAESLPKLRILIIDLYSHHQANALSVKMLPAFCHAMPWMQVFRPLLMDDKYALTLCDLVDWAKKPGNNTLSGMDSRSAINQLEPVVDAWVGNVSRGSDHHAIANLLAPRLLLSPSEKSEDKQEPAKEALSRLVENLGLLPHQDQQDNALLSVNNPWIDRGEQEWSQKLERLGNGKKLKLLLLDDQWEDGWGEVICKAIGVEFKPPEGEQENRFATIGSDQVIQVKACGSANWLFDEDKPLSDTSDQRFKLRLDGEGEDCQEILFLDLRLFSRKPVNEEAKFIEKLVGIAGELNEEDNPPWPNFIIDKKELTRIKKWTQEAESRGREDSAYIEALTLLPRILSLVDLAFPIIVFSSTGKREVTEKLSSYGNVITNLEKPRINSQIIEDIVQQVKYKFVNVFKKSLDILGARRKCFELSQLKTLVHLGAVDKVPEKEEQKHIYIEFFVDEGPEIKSVGGCYALFSGENMEAAMEKADAFDDEMVRQGVRFFEANVGVQPNPGAGTKAKKEDCDKGLQNTLKSADRPDCLGAFRLFNKLSVDNYSTENILHRSAIDNKYRLVLNALIELALFEMVPALKEESGASECLVSIYVGTKIFKSTKDVMYKNNYRFGINLNRFDDGIMQTSMPMDGVYPILIDQFSFHQESIRIHRAFATSLRYKPKPPQYYICRKCYVVSVNKRCDKCGSMENMSPDYRALHYIADEVMSSDKRGTKFPSNVRSPYHEIFKKSEKSVNYDGGLDDALNESLLASRSLDQGDVPTAIAKVKLPPNLNRVHFPSPHYWIARRISRRLHDIDGRDFMEIVELLRNDESLNYPCTGEVKIKENKKCTAYFGVLQDGVDKGKAVFISPSLVKKWEGENKPFALVLYKESNVNPVIPYMAIKIIR